MSTLIEGGNEDIRNDLYSLFSTHPSIQNFMKTLYAIVSDKLIKTQDILTKNTRIFNLLNDYDIYTFRKDHIDLFHRVSFFIT